MNVIEYQCPKPTIVGVARAASLWKRRLERQCKQEMQWVQVSESNSAGIHVLLCAVLIINALACRLQQSYIEYERQKQAELQQEIDALREELGDQDEDHEDAVVDMMKAFAVRGELRHLTAAHFC